MQVFNQVESALLNRTLPLLKQGVKILLGSLFLTLASQVAVLIPYSPIAMTFQTAALFLIGVSLGPIPAALSVLLYLVEGAFGLPVFALGRGGIDVLLGPKGGYYVGFVFAALISGAFVKKGDSFLKLSAVFSLANLSIYALGLSWLSLWIGMGPAITLGFSPFIVGDILKIFSVAALLKGLNWFRIYED